MHALVISCTFVKSNGLWLGHDWFLFLKPNLYSKETRNGVIDGQRSSMTFISKFQGVSVSFGTAK